MGRLRGSMLREVTELEQGARAARSVFHATPGLAAFLHHPHTLARMAIAEYQLLVERLSSSGWRERLP